MDGWVDIKAVLRVAYSNQKIRVKKLKLTFKIIFKESINKSTET
jgi:hypothetical protein